MEEGFQLLSKGAPEGPIADILDEVIRSTTQKLVESLERALPQYWSTESERAVSKVILCGGGALFPGMKEYLMERMALHVEIADPLKELSRDRSLPEDIGSTSRRVRPPLLN